VDNEVAPSAQPWVTEEHGEARKLAQILIATREKLGLDREEAARRAHIPLSYVEMLEGESSGKISDQIYLVPFLRRYAATLGLDGEDLAMRFVRELQRLESEAARAPEGFTLGQKRRNGRAAWIAAALVALVAIALGRLGRSYYREQSIPNPSKSVTTPQTVPSVGTATEVVVPSAPSPAAQSSPPVFGQSAVATPVEEAQPVASQPSSAPSVSASTSAEQKLPHAKATQAARSHRAKPSASEENTNEEQEDNDTE